MMWESRTTRSERERLQAAATAAKMERENARRALHEALRNLARYLEEIPLDEGIDQLGGAIAGRERKDDGG